MSTAPSGYEVMQLQNRMDVLGYERSLPGVWGSPEQGFVQFYAQQIGLDMATADGDAAIEAVLPAVDADISIVQSGALHTAPAGGGPVVAATTQITGQTPQDNGAGLWWALGAVAAAKLMGFF